MRTLGKKISDYRKTVGMPQDTHINLFILNYVVTGCLSRKVISHFVSKYGGDIPFTKEQIDQLLQELSRTAKRLRAPFKLMN